jgi:regulator of cell morphogenesis and NO signaling
MKLVMENAHVRRFVWLESPLAPPSLLSPPDLSASLWAPQGSIASLVGYIVDHHHAHTRSELKRLAALATGLGEGDRALEGVRDVLDTLTALDPELRAHMTKEEAVVFPYIVSLEAHLSLGRVVVRSRFGVLGRPLNAMLDEQCQTQSRLAFMRSRSGDYTPPRAASAQVCEFYEGLDALESDLAEHSRLETDILFARALELEQRATA